MCGIAGRLNFLTGAPVSGSVVQRMCDLLAHRGPDADGVYVDGAIGLGHRRLAIIDLSPAGRGPMVDVSGTLWITYNGEVYNFRELRTDLEERGHRFRSASDTEVILAAYREFGVDCLERLRGMFAFAIWDARTQTLFAARDRLGKKPFVYRLDRDGIAFASEPKAFLAEPGFRGRPNPVAISHYLTYRYVPSPHTAFEGVEKLPPAHYLLVRSDKVVVQRYWKLRYARKRVLTEQEACEELLGRLREAVKLRLISDVPLGAFLSGGIDSSTIVALMAEVSGSRVKTFSIGFDEREYDERPHARLIAERYGTDHHDFVVRPRAVEILSKLVWHHNEPFADPAAIPTYYLSELTRRHVTVALNGDGGDENFAGYGRYVNRRYADWYGRLPRQLRRSVELAARFVPSSVGSRSLAARGKRFLETVADPYRGYVSNVGYFHSELKTELCTEEFLRTTCEGDAGEILNDTYRLSDAPDLLDATLDVDVNTYLPDDLLVKVDIATMAHSLEGRCPFVDHEFMEFCASLPSHFKFRGRVRKYILKRAVRGLLPHETVKRPKMGFEVPIDRWLREDLREMTADVLLSPRAEARGYFRKGVVERLLREHLAGIRSWHAYLWTLLMLELWHRMFIDDPFPTAPQGATAPIGAG